MNYKTEQAGKHCVTARGGLGHEAPYETRIAKRQMLQQVGILKEAYNLETMAGKEKSMTCVRAAFQLRARMFKEIGLRLRDVYGQLEAAHQDLDQDDHDDLTMERVEYHVLKARRAAKDIFKSMGLPVKEKDDGVGVKD